MKRSLSNHRILLLVGLSLLLVVLGVALQDDKVTPGVFDGERAFEDLAHQVSLGPRVPGSEAHAAQIEWMRSGLQSGGWSVELQEVSPLGEPIFNLIAKRGEGKPLVLIGAHYDTRPIADSDPDPENRNLPISGANDGASGVAILMELARVIPADIENEIWLVFFDAEDGFNIPGWGLSLGSKTFVAELTERPDAVVIVDMIGDADLAIPIDGLSDPELVEQIWSVAAELGYADVFRNEIGIYVLDDHTPFNEAGIPAVVLIDFSYPYWHAVDDTVDKVSSESLQIVGDTLLAWLLAQ